MHNYFKLLTYLKPYLRTLAIGILCLVLATVAHLFLPWIVRDVIDDVLIQKNLQLLNFICILVLVVYILRGFFNYCQQYLIELVAQRVVFDLRNQLFESMIKQRGLAYFEKNRTGGLMSYFTNDIGMLQHAIINSGVSFVREVFVAVGSISYMFSLSWRLTLFMFITAPLIAFAVRKLGKRIKRMGAKVLAQLQEFTASLQETLSGIRIVKSFAREEFESVKFRKQLDANLKAVLKATKINAVLSPIIEFLATVGVVLLIWFGGRSVINGDMTPGSLVAFLIYAVNLANPIKRISHTYGRIQQALAGCDRVFGAIEFDPEIKDKPEAKPLPQITGKVELKNVSFAYNSESAEVINDFSFEVEPGLMIALVGHSGAGKSTLANLIMRFYDVSNGSILIDGIDIRDVTQKSLREQVGIVPQETMLFSGTVYDNILYGRLSATDEEVMAAAKAAHVDEFASQLPEGYQTLVGERGLTLSGGQRQRVAIARAILKDPKILILDEATSALDTQSEKLVQNALETLLKGRTSFVIAHRLSTIYKADTIVVLDHGRLVESGSHSELLKHGGLYAKLYNTQFHDDMKYDEEGTELIMTDLDSPSGNLEKV